jgi:hypothetical protein
MSRLRETNGSVCLRVKHINGKASLQFTAGREQVTARFPKLVNLMGMPAVRIVMKMRINWCKNMCTSKLGAGLFCVQLSGRSPCVVQVVVAAVYICCYC